MAASSPHPEPNGVVHTTEGLSVTEKHIRGIWNYAVGEGMASNQEQVLMDVLRLEEAEGRWVEASPCGTKRHLGETCRKERVSLDHKCLAIKGGVGLMFDLE